MGTLEDLRKLRERLAEVAEEFMTDNNLIDGDRFWIVITTYNPEERGFGVHAYPEDADICTIVMNNDNEPYEVTSVEQAVDLADLFVFVR